MTIELPILMYHSVEDRASDQYAPYVISPARFREQMEYLRDNGWTALGMTELAARIAGGGPFPERCLAITFDDGLADFAEHAWPILQETGLTATLYVTTGYVGEQARWLAPLGEGHRPMLTWDQLRTMQGQGLEIGAHSHTHPHLDLVAPEVLAWELSHSKAVLERELGVEISTVAYPHGSHDTRVRRAAIDAGYRAAAAVKNAMSSSDDDRFALARITVMGDTDLDRFAEMLVGEGVDRPPRHERLRTRAFRNVRRFRNGRGRSLGVTTPAPRTAWAEICAGDPGALVTQTPAWMDAVTRHGSFTDASRLYELDDGRRFVLPLVRRAGWPSTVAPEWGFPSGWGFGGLVGADLDASAVDVAVTDLRTGSPLRTVIRPNPLSADAWREGVGDEVTVVDRRAHVLDLRQGQDAVWSAFRQGARRSVRQAEKSGLEIECATSGRLIPEFYGLLEQSFGRWARQQHEPGRLARWRYHREDPVSKFEAMAEALGDGFHIWVARKDGVPVATLLVLQGANAHYTRGAMDKDLAGPTRANYALHWHAIRSAIDAGCGWYQMGESGSSDSLAHFKERFGATPLDYAEYRIERLPVTGAENRLKGAVKRVVGFRDA